MASVNVGGKNIPLVVAKHDKTISTSQPGQKYGPTIPPHPYFLGVGSAQPNAFNYNTPAKGTTMISPTELLIGRNTAIYKVTPGNATQTAFIIPPNFTPRDLCMFDGLIYVGDSNQGITSYNKDTGAYVNSYATNKYKNYSAGHGGMSFDSSGLFWVGSQNDQFISCVDLLSADPYTAIHTGNLPAGEYSQSLTFDGSYICVLTYRIGGTPTVYRFNPADGSIVDSAVVPSETWDTSSALFFDGIDIWHMNTTGMTRRVSGFA